MSLSPNGAPDAGAARAADHADRDASATPAEAHAARGERRRFPANCAVIGRDLLALGQTPSRESERDFHEYAPRRSPKTAVGAVWCPAGHSAVESENGRVEPSWSAQIGMTALPSIVASQARIDRPVDKQRASHPLPQAAFKLASSLRHPGLAHVFNDPLASLQENWIVALRAQGDAQHDCRAAQGRAGFQVCARPRGSDGKRIARAGAEKPRTNVSAETIIEGGTRRRTCFRRLRL